jgi:hypothetical protein
MTFPLTQVVATRRRVDLLKQHIVGQRIHIEQR